MANKVWHAKEAVIKMALDSNITVTTSAVLDSFFSSGTNAPEITGVVKDLTITEPIGDGEVINLLGDDANGFQNQEFEEKPPGLVEVSGTAILPGDEVMSQFLYDAGTAIAGTHTRYRAGKSSIRQVAMLLNLDDGTDEVSFAGVNMRLTAKETSIGGADGHFEMTFTAKCLARDWHGPEFKD